MQIVSPPSLAHFRLDLSYRCSRPPWSDPLRLSGGVHAATLDFFKMEPGALIASSIIQLTVFIIVAYYIICITYQFVIAKKNKSFVQVNL